MTLIDLSQQGEPKKLLWTTDMHLDATDKAHIEHYLSAMSSQNPTAVLIGGDICNGIHFLTFLKNMAEKLKRPLYFVLGNHDFYHGSIYKMRSEAFQLFEELPDLVYLTGRGIIELSPTTALIGHDGWYDGKAGDFMQSAVILNDYHLIEELTNLTPEARLAKLNELGEEAARYLRRQLMEALQRYSQVILLTHVPPFIESCVHEGELCDANWGPHFVSQGAGEAIREVAQQFPDKRVLVLCGHTHASADVAILPNVRALTGASELGNPAVQGVILFD